MVEANVDTKPPLCEVIILQLTESSLALCASSSGAMIVVFPPSRMPIASPKNQSYRIDSQAQMLQEYHS